jgi:hypothetical protein
MSRERPRRRAADRLGAVAAAALALLLASGAAAQTARERLDLTREAVENQRRVLVSGSLPLTEAEAKAFWPLYDGYEKERRSLDERANKLVADYIANASSLTDPQAKALTDEALKIDEERARQRRAWFDRMAKAIPPRKLARLYQIDNKLDSMVRADISRQVPLTP